MANTGVLLNRARAKAPSVLSIVDRGGTGHVASYYQSARLADSKDDPVNKPISYAAAQVLRVLPRTTISRVAGRAAEFLWPGALRDVVLNAYCKAYNVDLSEAAASRDTYDSFDAFFTRALKAGARPIHADANVAVSPADGQVASFGEIDAESTFVVKGRPYRLVELLGDASEAERFQGGRGCVVYLSPRDYHRVHVPCEGVLSRVNSLPGDYFPVNEFGVKHIPQLFIRNRRVACFVDTPEHGRVAIILVAAMVVGRISVLGIDERDVPVGEWPMGKEVARGDELGRFHLGSTAVVLFEAKAGVEWVMPEGPIRMGEPLARLRRATEFKKNTASTSRRRRS